MKKTKIVTAVIGVFVLIVAYATLLPQYFPYEFLIKTYYSL